MPVAKNIWNHIGEPNFSYFTLFFDFWRTSVKKHQDSFKNNQDFVNKTQNSARQTRDLVKKMQDSSWKTEDEVKETQKLIKKLTQKDSEFI